MTTKKQVISIDFKNLKDQFKPKTKKITIPPVENSGDTGNPEEDQSLDDFIEVVKRGDIKGSNNEILQKSLALLANEMLPSAINNYVNDQKQGQAYTVTNIVSEVRSIISQLESSVNSNAVVDAVDEAIVAALRLFYTSVTSYIGMVSDGLDLKVADSGVRRDIKIILKGITSEIEKQIQNTIKDVDKRVEKAIKEVVNNRVGRKR